MARLNVLSTPATGFNLTVNTTAVKTPYYSDYPDGTVLTVTWPETQTITSRGLIFSRDVEFAYERMYWDKNLTENLTATITLPAGTTNVTGIYRKSAVKVTGPLGLWWFPIVSRVFGRAPLAR
jgi:hypothetical protein